MQFLKNLGGGGIGTGATKGATPAAKPNYFSSLKLEDDPPKTEKGGKENNKNKKNGPPKGFVPQKFALDFTPPAIIMEYRNPENNKLYHHKMKIKKLKKETSSKEALDYLKKKHYHYFIPKVIDEAQIQKLIQKLKNGLIIGENRSGLQDVDEDGDFDYDYDDDFED